MIAEPAVINYEAWRFWWEVLITFAVFGNFFYQWLLSGDRVTRESIKNVSASVDELENRVIVLEQDMPTDARWDGLYNRLGEV